MEMVRCNECMEVFKASDIICDEEKELCPKCYTEGCLMDVATVIMVCDKCGKNNVRRNADCSWDVDEQKWVISSLFDSATCEDCGEECNLIEKELPNEWS